MKKDIEKNNKDKQLIVRLSLEARQKFNIKCINNNTSMQEVLSDFIYNYIAD